LFVVNLAAKEGEGEEHVFINPTLSRPRGNDEKEEGCLSLPGLYGQVIRPETVVVSAYTLEGEEFEGELSGLFSRVVQHETDHLDGVLFFDRFSETGAMDARDALDVFVSDFEQQRSRGEIPSDDEIATRRNQWEAHYC
jgi:peptide deformylase